MAECLTVIDVIETALPPITVVDVISPLPPGSVPPHGATHAPTGSDPIPGVGAVPHHATHETGGTDAIIALNGAVITTGIVVAARIDPAIARVGAAPTAHHSTHDTGGTDALTAIDASVIATGTVGVARLPVHHTTHDSGGSDPITALNANVLTTGTLAVGRLPTHHSTHETGGADALVAVDAGVLTSGTLPNARLAPAVAVTSSIAIGTNPATTGAIRLANNTSMIARNAANTADWTLIGSDASGNCIVSNAGFTTTILTGGQIALQAGGANRWFVSPGGMFYTTADNVYDIGVAPTNRPRNIYVAGAVANRTKAGTPVDADVNTPTDGMLIVDTTASKIWVRVGGVWKGVAVA